MILYGELTKVEAQPDGSIKVYGVASSGARDQAGEIVSPEAMRRALPDYLAFGAIREMHEPRAAGAALSAQVDADGATRVSAHIVDPVAVKKVQAGVYKGLSIGGKVLGRDPADSSVITAIRLDEISLVDRPCNPEAVIDLWKAAPNAAPTNAPTNAEVKAEADRLARQAGKPGRRNDYLAKAREGRMRNASFETPALQAPQDDAGLALAPNLRHAEERSDSLASRSTQPGPHQHPEGDVSQAPHGSFADALAAKYPLDTSERIRAAWAAIAKPQNRDGYPTDEIAALEARIAAAWRTKVDPAGPPSAGPAAPVVPTPPIASTKAQAPSDLRKLAELERALADARTLADSLSKRLDAQAAEIERLSRQPLPPRAAGSHLAKAISKAEDAGAVDRQLTADDLARALDAMAPADRAHLLMKAALSRPIPL